MVTALELIETIEEKNLLHAQIYTILSRYDDAEQLYLESSRPMEALNVCKNYVIIGFTFLQNFHTMSRGKRYSLS